METATYIETLLRKYQQAPSFPFYDWPENPVSFYALINLWDDLFKTAAGQQAGAYGALRDVTMDIDSLIYDVGTHDRVRRVCVYPEPEGGTFNLFFKAQTDGYRPGQVHLGHLPDRTSLEFATDLHRDRLIACFEIIRLYSHTEIASYEAAETLYDALVGQYRPVFGFPDFDPWAPLPDDEDDTPVS